MVRGTPTWRCPNLPAVLAIILLALGCTVVVEALAPKHHRFRAAIAARIASSAAASATTSGIPDWTQWVSQADTNKLYTKDASNPVRHQIIKNVPLKMLMCAPGHRRLRHPEKVLGIAKKLLNDTKRSQLVQKWAGPKEKLQLSIKCTGNPPNLFIKTIEVQDGNHRAAAMVASGKFTKLGDLPENVFMIKVNGQLPADLGGHKYPRWIPYDVAERGSKVATCDKLIMREISEKEGAKGRTAEVGAEVTSVDRCFQGDDRGVTLRQVVQDTLARFSADAKSDPADKTQFQQLAVACCAGDNGPEQPPSPTSPTAPAPPSPTARTP